MPIESTGELFAALAADRFEDIIGTPEGPWLEFKSAPYRFDEQRQKWEYAKDVGALSNGDGGCIVFGFKATRNPNELVEKVTEVRLVSKTLVDIDQYRSLLAEWLYPQTRGLKFKWFPNDPAQPGAFVIEIPPQNDRDKLFCVKKMIDPDGSELGNAVGFPRREGDTVAWLPATEIHRLVSDGRLMSEGRRGPIQQALPLVDTTGRDARAERRLEEILALEDWSGTAALVVQALPPSTAPSILPGFYEYGGIRAALESPDSIRPTGFNLRTAYPLDVREGALVSLQSARKAFWLDPDGLFTAAAAVPDFLTWGLQRERSGDEVRLPINSIALVEFVFEWFRFVHSKLIPAAGGGRWRFRIVCRHFQSPEAVTLAPGLPDQMVNFMDGKRASADDWDRELESQGSPERDAFCALEVVYSLFGLPASAIPLVEGGAVSADRLRSPR